MANEYGEGRGILSAREKSALVVPVMGRNASELARAARAVKVSAADIVEWRIDHLSDLSNAVVAGSAQILRREVDLPILATFRTKQQGGLGAPSDFMRILEVILESGVADLIDVESGAPFAKEAALQAFAKGVPVVLSHHDFDATPGVEAIVAQLEKMQEELAAWSKEAASLPEAEELAEVGAVKVAYMPTETMDALKLAVAARHFKNSSANLPFIALSMGDEGMMTRAFAGAIGSVATFAAIGARSAPGQIDLGTLAAFADETRSLDVRER
ncbi:MAG: type I 3-dehydroquinate dehydratase [Actinomycetaceae bacterium]|nr:type I 3-dehydroquinate dehydratase [Actinomycetaceae bacterium]